MSTIPTVNNLKNLLDSTKRIVLHHEEMTKIKGESFNLFSVLNVETRENKTHSAFLAELLNPKGCHLQGAVFLELFLEVVSRKVKENSEKNSLRERFIKNGNSTVIKEFGIGKRDDLEKVGGRVDIYIEKGLNTLCIENKIYAQDQYTQLERYCNYNKENNNTVFYLTLHGQDASEGSKGCLESGKDYYNLSYKEDIIDWLELCLKEVPNLTSVRESINQYILLIKKLTHNLHMEQEKELNETMSRYLEEASYIANNYEEMLSKFRDKFRSDVREYLINQIDSIKYTVENGLPVSNKFSQLWVHINTFDKEEMKFGVESFSGKGHDNGDMFVGLIDMNKSEILKDLNSENEKNEYWRFTRPILTKDGNVINLHHMFSLKIISNSESAKYKEMVLNVGKQIHDFIKDYEGKLPARVFSKNLN